MRTKLVSALAVFALALPGACSDSLSTTPNHGDGIGALMVRLTDAPFLTDSLKSVDIFVVRVDGRVTATDDNEANSNLDDGGSSGWQTLASPNAAFNLLALQNGVSTSL